MKQKFWNKIFTSISKKSAPKIFIIRNIERHEKMADRTDRYKKPYPVFIIYLLMFSQNRTGEIRLGTNYQKVYPPHFQRKMTPGVFLKN